MAQSTLLNADKTHWQTGAEGAGFFSRLIGNDEAVLGDEKREAALQSCEAPLTVVRVGKLVDAPGGTSEIQVAQVFQTLQKSLTDNLFAHVNGQLYSDLLAICCSSNSARPGCTLAADNVWMCRVSQHLLAISAEKMQPSC